MFKKHIIQVRILRNAFRSKIVTSLIVFYKNKKYKNLKLQVTNIH